MSDEVDIERAYTNADGRIVAVVLVVTRENGDVDRFEVGTEAKP